MFTLPSFLLPPVFEDSFAHLPTTAFLGGTFSLRLTLFLHTKLPPGSEEMLWGAELGKIEYLTVFNLRL